MFVCACVDGPSGYHSHLLGALSVATQAGLGIVHQKNCPLNSGFCYLALCNIHVHGWVWQKWRGVGLGVAGYFSANAINELQYVLRLCITK